MSTKTFHIPQHFGWRATLIFIAGIDDSSVHDYIGWKKITDDSKDWIGSELA